MSQMSDYTENKVNNHVYGSTAWSIPGTQYFALLSGAPTDAGGGTELSGIGYARLAITNNTTNFPNASGGVKTNGTAFNFSPASGGNWATATHWATYDASSGGNLLFWGALTTPVTVTDTSDCGWAIGQLQITLTGCGTYLANKILDLIFGATTWSIPATLYLALYQTALTAAGAGTEISTGSYARQSITNNTTNFPNAVDGSKSNGVAIAFPVCSLSYSYAAWGLFDASSGGNLYQMYTLDNPETVAVGDRRRFTVGELIIQAL
jgi:hypothetical protein